MLLEVNPPRSTKLPNEANLFSGTDFERLVAVADSKLPKSVSSVASKTVDDDCCDCN